MSELETPAPAARASILLVDDQAFVAEVLRRMFADEADFDFQACLDPAQALEQALRCRPTVILQDLVMGDTDGLEMVRRFRGRPETADVPIIVLSVKEEPETKSQAFALGANDYLVKLPDRLELIARVRYHSRACHDRRDRDRAFAELVEANRKLEEALAQVKQLRGLLPICGYCKRVRDGQNYWNQIESYLSSNADVQFTHGVCEDCFDRQLRDLGMTPEQGAAIAARLQQQRAGVSVSPPPE